VPWSHTALNWDTCQAVRSINRRHMHKLDLHNGQNFFSQSAPLRRRKFHSACQSCAHRVGGLKRPAKLPPLLIRSRWLMTGARVHHTLDDRRRAHSILTTSCLYPFHPSARTKGPGTAFISYQRLASVSLFRNMQS
jgi:hypothetical protein